RHCHSDRLSFPTRRSSDLELQTLGYRFFSDGDTEVLLKAWHAWGQEAPKRFNGMFAFAIVERDSGRLVLGRDRLGIKPLYYAETDRKSTRLNSSHVKTSYA